MDDMARVVLGVRSGAPRVVSEAPPGFAWRWIYTTSRTPKVAHLVSAQLRGGTGRAPCGTSPTVPDHWSDPDLPREASIAARLPRCRRCMRSPLLG